MGRISDKMRVMRHLLPALLFLGILAPASAETAKSALDKATLEAYIRHLFLWGPQIQVTISDPKPSEMPGLLAVRIRAAAAGASQEQVFYVSKDGRKILRAAVYDVTKNPFHEDLEKLKTDSQPALGTPGAPVVIVVFSDFQCGYCAKEGQMLRQNLTKSYPEQVRLYFKDFPLDQIHPWARMAAIAGRCVYRESEEAFWAYHDWAFSKQSELTPENFRTKFLEFAKSNGKLDGFKLGNCLDNRVTEAEVNQSVAEAQQLQVNSTPTLFVNGRRISAQIPWENLKQVIDFEIEYQKTAHNAGEACCAVKLPTPLDQ
jgi:protein-disulfide isomerase